MREQFTVTIFGAESTGKTTLSRQLAKLTGAAWTHEFARPYLEKTGAEMSRRSMTTIWKGQLELQEQAPDVDQDIIIQDTDLYSTIGYWQLPHITASIGVCPEALVVDAQRLQSDLYIITLSNIPFEQDPLRYGGDGRESADSYWVNLCETYHIPYVLLSSSSQLARLSESITIINERSPRSCVTS